MTEQIDITDRKAAEKELHTALVKAFTQAGFHDQHGIVMGPDDDYVFVVAGFMRPENVEAFAEPLGDRAGDMRGLCAATTMNVYPPMQPDENGQVHRRELLGHGVHVVAASILSDIVSQHAMGHAIKAAQELVVTDKGEGLDA